jgi:hypothetical protein
MNLRVSYNAGKFLSGCTIGGFTRRPRSLKLVRCWWENNIKMDIIEVELSDMEWIDLYQVRKQWRVLVNAAMNLCVP